MLERFLIVVVVIILLVIICEIIRRNLPHIVNRSIENELLKENYSNKRHHNRQNKQHEIDVSCDNDSLSSLEKSVVDELLNKLEVAKRDYVNEGYTVNKI